MAQALRGLAWCVWDALTLRSGDIVVCHFAIHRCGERGEVACVYFLKGWSRTDSATSCLERFLGGIGLSLILNPPFSFGHFPQALAGASIQFFSFNSKELIVVIQNFYKTLFMPPWPDFSLLYFSAILLLFAWRTTAKHLSLERFQRIKQLNSTCRQKLFLKPLSIYSGFGQRKLNVMNYSWRKKHGAVRAWCVYWHVVCCEPQFVPGSH